MEAPELTEKQPEQRRMEVREGGFSIINPATGQVLPEGQEGELVITTLSRRGMPLIRYRTGPKVAVELKNPVK